jgi:hypothetical protein
MPHRLEIDRFEGPIAVLLGEDGKPIELPRALLPAGAAEGSVLRFSLEIDEEATKALSDELKAVQKELKKTDPGGDLTL